MFRADRTGTAARASSTQAGVTLRRTAEGSLNGSAAGGADKEAEEAETEEEEEEEDDDDADKSPSAADAA